MMNSFDKIIEWYLERSHVVVYNVEQISLSELNEWSFNKKTGYWKHKSGKFFTIQGIEVHTNLGNVRHWFQPIIFQPEIGILGILTKKINSKRKYLIQAKMEPGNINKIQLSPTVQATKSNYSRVHKGKKTTFIDYFLGSEKSVILADRLQYEQGSMFYGKINRNMLVEVNDDIELPSDFYWMSSDDIGNLLHMENMINMDTRSVFSCVLCKDESEHPINSDNDILNWLSLLRSNCTIKTNKVPLYSLVGWNLTPDIIYYEEDKYFSVIGVKVTSDSREVTTWTQPIFKKDRPGFAGFLAQEIHGTLHYLVQAKLESGKKTIYLAPTVQCSDYEQKIDSEIYLKYFFNNNNVIYDKIQSEEGGRFYHFLTRNMVVLLDDDIDISKYYIWMTYNQILTMIDHGYFNIEARTLMTCLNVIKTKRYKYD